MNDGRLIIVAGNKRAGKTTLCSMLVEKGFIHLNCDNILDALDEVVGSNKLDFDFFNILVSRYYRDAKNYNQNIVFDIYDFNPGMLKKLKEFNNVELLVLAYPNANKEDIKHCLQKYGEDFQWNKTMTEDDLNRNINLIVEKNKILEEECKKYNIKLFDVGIKEQRNIKINDVFNYIIDKTNQS